MNAALPVTAADPLQALLSRRSHWPLTEPAPDGDALDTILDAALRAPDHGALRPWRFVLIRGAARESLGDLFVACAAARTPDAPAGAHEHRRQKALAAPLIIALGAALSAHPKVPESEQLLAVGAAAMNLLNAVHLLGYGGFWASGPDSRASALHDALGFAPNEQVLGFLYVGTPVAPASAVARPARDAYVREWRGPAR
ncbi:nitroreductase [Burkholderia sp. FERM BP-3421]|jgi:nitroreductase|uniref:nitroreductase family protein n=1 Tax=Burkholderia sp. FERM BP-3421 TaxID=1494466 RepID=UPI002361BFDC|nr:nitroreductase [Burkholderia sp. FERM BP-3421]WDD92496.1 nitroreductase [Burkholderia sp. FERM BP-3421]